MGKTVGELLSVITSSELAGWMAFLELEAESREKIKTDEKNKKAADAQELLKARLTQAGKMAAKKKDGKA